MYAELKRAFEEHVTIAPLLAFESLSDFGVLSTPWWVRGVYEMELPKVLTEKLVAARLGYLYDLVNLSATEVCRRARLGKDELDILTQALHYRGRHFHPAATLTPREQADLLMDKYAGQLKALQDAGEQGDINSLIWLANFDKKFLLPGRCGVLERGREFLEKAYQLGSAWAGNDLGVNQLRSSNYFQHVHSILSKFKFAHRAGLPQGTYNLAVGRAILKVDEYSVRPLLEEAFSKGVVQAAVVIEEL